MSKFIVTDAQLADTYKVVVEDITVDPLNPVFIREDIEAVQPDGSARYNIDSQPADTDYRYAFTSGAKWYLNVGGTTVYSWAGTSKNIEVTRPVQPAAYSAIDILDA